ncbi:MAG TPA: tetratricopeptide repeat protein [Pseudolysinimonas sp.]|nr:tetratricopeptide repeat protein [Pseudolysinimonas sp.]
MAQAVPPPGPSLRGAVDLSGLVRRANAPEPPPGEQPGGQPEAGGLVFPATDATFESVLQLSSRVPVVIEFYAPGLQPSLGAVVESYGGRLVLATVDGQTNPQLAQAFQVREVPAVAAVIAGRPVNLFLGIPSDEEVRQVFDELLTLAAQNGVTGRIDAGGDAAEDGEQGEPAAPVEEPLPPHHQEAFDAIGVGDYATAIAEYRQALAENPRDGLAVAGLAQVSLLQRLDGADAGALRSAAADAPQSAAAQLAVADLDVSGGHLDDAFGRLLDLFPSLDGEAKQQVRTRLLEYFEIAGPDDPRVAAARRRLTALLY